jgi:hypothetical protein
VFVGSTGAIPRRINFQATWRTAVEAAGVLGLHFHDLRHTGNMLAAESASLRELMARMGHSSTRAALIYQHASRDRERAIAAAVSARVEAARPKVEGHDRARRPRLSARRHRVRSAESAPDLRPGRSERVTGIEPALSAWEGPRDQCRDQDLRGCGRLTASDR